MAISKDEIYFTLDDGPLPKLTAQYRGHSASIALSLVPDVWKSEVPLLFEEQVKLAQDYLCTILYKESCCCLSYRQGISPCICGCHSKSQLEQQVRAETLDKVIERFKKYFHDDCWASGEYEKGAVIDFLTKLKEIK